MAHFCGFIKLIFLLLMLVQIPSNETRPLKGNSQINSDLIAGNEFLKLFMEHDQLDKDFYSSGGSGGSDSGNAGAERRKIIAAATKKEESYDKKSAEAGRRSSSGRSLKDKGPKLNQAEGQLEDSKQVVKLVTSGSKIVFLEDYDENDAILDAEARDIDLKREISKSHSNLDDYKVVAVSVSSSSQRGTTTTRNRFAHKATSAKYDKRPTTTAKTTSKMTTTTTTTSKAFVTMTPKPPTVPTVRSQTSPTSASSAKIDATAGDNFINRSHKSEFSIEEVEPLTMTQQQKSRKIHSRQRTYPMTSVSDTLEALDSENSASTNIHNVLAAPLQPSASARSTSMVTTTYHSGQRNMTINHDSNLHAAQARHKTASTTTTNTDDDKSKAGDLQQHMTSGSGGGSGVEDQLLPFQTVIYHDTKAGHGPQSRSISYSSISQNVEDLKKWHQSGILAEARRNVSESLKPMPRTNVTSSNHQPETAKFYSQPSKMYSEPAKFYSEPSKVYSEPAKVYGEQEKFYSEPAKVYGQPSKFYSEPSKVYSQPAKVYSEPAKTYWPVLTGTTTTSTHTPSITIPPTDTPTITTTPYPVNIHQSSKKPAIVSRIAFGEAHLTSSTTSTTSTTTTTTHAPLTTTSRTYGSHNQHQYSRTYSSHRNPSSFSSSTSFNNENASLSSPSSSSSTPSRRILFNLDRLPYDLLNAPEPSIQQQQLLELQKTKRPQQTLTYQQSKQQQHQQPQQQQQQQQQRHNINPCLESAVSSLFSSSSLSAHPAVLKQRQQHSSLSDQQQHSNQNAKGLPNGDLVKCVAEISHTSSAAAASHDDNDDTSGGVEAFTTERSHIEEQNYEIEESVSVVTNGRAHSGGRNSLTQPTTSPKHQQQHHGFKPNRQRTRVHFGTNVNNPEVHDDGHHLSQTSYNTNANNNADININKNRHHTAPDYSQYDDDTQNDNSDDGGGGGGDDDSADKNNDYEDAGSPANANDDDSNNGNGGDNDDSKVAYIVEGHNYRKYRVEEETDDGFIVGEYGVVDHNDGNLRGVRYTADSTINRSLIQKALLTFLKLK